MDQQLESGRADELDLPPVFAFRRRTSAERAALEEALRAREAERIEREQRAERAAAALKEIWLRPNGDGGASPAEPSEAPVSNATMVLEYLEDLKRLAQVRPRWALIIAASEVETMTKDLLPPRILRHEARALCAKQRGRGDESVAEEHAQSIVAWRFWAWMSVVSHASRRFIWQLGEAAKRLRHQRIWVDPATAGEVLETLTAVVRDLQDPPRDSGRAIVRCADCEKITGFPLSQALASSVGGSMAFRCEHCDARYEYRAGSAYRPGGL